MRPSTPGKSGLLAPSARTGKSSMAFGPTDGPALGVGGDRHPGQHEWNGSAASGTARLRIRRSPRLPDRYRPHHTQRLVGDADQLERPSLVECERDDGGLATPDCLINSKLVDGERMELGLRRDGELYSLPHAEGQFVGVEGVIPAASHILRGHLDPSGARRCSTVGVSTTTSVGVGSGWVGGGGGDSIVAVGSGPALPPQAANASEMMVAAANMNLSRPTTPVLLSRGRSLVKGRAHL